MPPVHRRFRVLLHGLALGGALLAGGCAVAGGVPPQPLDPPEGVRHFRMKMESAREASLGGYGEAAPGGCGCQ